MTKANPPDSKSDSAGRYSGTEQQDVPEYRHGSHRHGKAGRESGDSSRKPWHGPPESREGHYGYRHDEGAHGRPVDGDAAESDKTGPNEAGKAGDTE
jgi:hypothetical protein